jgi:hypothetical protein
MDFIFSILLIRRGEDRRGQAPLVQVDRISIFFWKEKTTTLPEPYDAKLTNGRTVGRMSWAQASRVHDGRRYHLVVLLNQRLIGPSVSQVITQVKVTKFSPTSPNEHTRSIKTTDRRAHNSLCEEGFNRRVNDHAYSLE